MSQLYPDLTNAFPDSIDPNRSFSDVTSSNRALVEQYYTYKSSGNDSAATDLLNNNPNLKNTIVTAEMIQLIYDMNISQQRFYLNDVQQYLVNIVKQKGNWNETTTYTKYDVVQYVVNGAIQSYMGAVVNIPIGTLPTNTSYYVPITLRGEQGASGTGLSVRGVWNSLDTYYVNDCVSLNNAMWYAIVENTNNAPNDLSTYWKKFADLPSPIRVSTTQPASQNVGDEWHQISDTDNSLAIKVKQADGSYVAKNVVSNASFITDSDSAGLVRTYTCTTTGTVHALVGTGSNGKFLADANFVSGDTFTINGTTVSATLQNGSALDSDFFKSGCWVNFIYDGTKLNFSSGGSKQISTTYAGKLTVSVSAYDGGSIANTKVRIQNSALGMDLAYTPDALGKVTVELTGNKTYSITLIDVPEPYYGEAATQYIGFDSDTAISLQLKDQPDVIGFRFVYRVDDNLNSSGVPTPYTVEYIEGAAGWTPMSMSGSGASFVLDPGSFLNSWLVKDIRPCVVKEGVVQYYFKRTGFMMFDYTLQENGLPAKTDGTDGDVMIEYPKIYTKVSQPIVGNSRYIEFRFAKEKLDSGYVADAWTNSANIEMDTMYVSRYKPAATAISSSNTHPAFLSLDQHRTNLYAKGAGYYPITYVALAYFRLLFVMTFRTFDFNSVFGYGSAESWPDMYTGATNSYPLCYGSSSAYLRTSFFGIEDFVGPGSIDGTFGGIWLDGVWVTLESTNLATYYKRRPPFNSDSTVSPTYSHNTSYNSSTGYILSVEQSNRIIFSYQTSSSVSAARIPRARIETTTSNPATIGVIGNWSNSNLSSAGLFSMNMQYSKSVNKTTFTIFIPE